MLNGFGDVEGPQGRSAQRSASKVGYHGADMSKPAEIEAMMAYAAQEFGGVDILVNNAGIQHVANVEDFPVEKWDAIIAINLSSAFHATRLALPGMRRQQLGPHHQHRLGARPGGLGAEVGLRGGQARHRRLDQGGGAGNRHHRHHRQRHLPGLGADAAGAEADRCARRDATVSTTTRPSVDLLAEKQPSLQFTTPEQLGELAVFLCSPAGRQRARRRPGHVDGGWTAQ